MYTVDDIGVVFTNCLYPEYTTRAIQSMMSFYPGLEGVIVDDHCHHSYDHLSWLATSFGFPLIMNEKRMGTGRSIDRGLRLLTRPLLLTVDHGVELKQTGILERYVKLINSDSIGVGPKRNDKRCNKAFGPYIDPVLALWDREFIVAHPELSFKLTHIRIGNWQVDGCSTAQFLQYRAGKLGRGMLFCDPYEYIWHHRTPKDRGGCASPHELVIVEEDYLVQRLRKLDGTLVYQVDA